MKSNTVNEKVVKAIIILAKSGEYSHNELYEMFDLLMGYRTVGESIDTWSAILETLANSSMRELAVN